MQTNHHGHQRPFAIKKGILAIACAMGYSIAQADLVGLGAGSNIMAISGDGTVVGGYMLSNGGTAHIWNGTTPVSIGVVNGYSDTQVQGLSADGSVAVGAAMGFDVNFNYLSQAFKWTQAGGLIALGGLSSGQNSEAAAVSGDGGVIVGGAAIADGTMHAVRWVGPSSTISDLSGGAFTQYSRAQGVSTDGSVIVGYGMAGSVAEAFRWTSGGGMTGLGFLSGKTGSEATGVSGDGSVIVGNSYTFGAPTDVLAFRWTSGGGMVDLGMLSGGTTARANAVNADGSVVVGDVQNANASFVSGFRWTQSTGMQRVADWLAANGVNVGDSTLRTAVDVSDDGHVVVGYGNINGTQQAYIARVGGSTGGSSSGGPSANESSGLIGMSDFTNSLSSAAAVFGTGASFTQMTMFGAHHRPLMDMGLPGGNCAWATADYGRNTRTDVHQHLEEIGVCGDFGPTRLGIGIGNSGVRQDLAFGGDGDYDGRHVLAEADYRIGTSLLTSLTAFYGRWDASIDRNYLNGAGVDTSHGNTDAVAWALRARLDWLDLAQWNGSSLSTFAAYTHTRNHLDGFTETGGGFPVRFDSSDHAARELRLGAGLRTEVTPRADLRLTAEAVHRFDGRGATVSGQIVGLSSFNFQGGDIKQNWARAGAEVDYRFTSSSVVSASVNTSSEGEDATWSGSVSWKIAF